MNEEARARLRAHLRRRKALNRRLEEIRDRLAVVIVERRRAFRDMRDML